jgi:16S rRNA (guanine1207-N2)-methyltransferase
MRADAPLQTLFLPFIAGPLKWPESARAGVLFLRARAGAPLAATQLPGLICEQTFKPDADALQRAGFHIVSHASGRYPLVLVLPPRQREEARALFARAVDATRAGGQIVACAANDEGARSAEADLERLVGPVTTLTKNRCRVFWSAPLDHAGENALANEWRQLDAPRPIENGRFVSRPGVFAWDRIDPGSALLAEQLPRALSGRAADLGCGFGYLAVELLERCRGIAALDLYEAESRALDLARHNVAAFESRVALGYHWHDVTSGLPNRYDVIVTNPPFHTHARADRPDIGRSFVTAAFESLNRGGQLWLVANRHLPYEIAFEQAFGEARTITQRHGFKVMTAIKRLARGAGAR